jgi:glycosyltransferase involved in cell wall biosynthesis
MRVIVASTVVPFVSGGYTVIVDSLADNLRKRGHDVEVLLFPFSSSHTDLMEQMLAFRLLDLSRHGDRLITVRFPSYLLRHPNKAVWFIHHHRGAYDLWGTEYQDIPGTPEGVAIRDSVRSADAAGLAECRRVFSNSQVVAGRLKQYNGVAAEVLYPPLPNAERYSCAGYGDFVLYLGRLVHHKRQWLALEAMRHVQSGVRLVIAGKADPDAMPYVADLYEFVRRHKLQDRVTILSDWVDEKRKIELFSQCLAAAYFPVDEDSYGYPSLEAHHSRKAVLTTTDSGGTLELIRDGENGFVSDPSPQAIAGAMDRLYLDRPLSRKMGEAGETRLDELGISWEHVIGRILA